MNSGACIHFNGGLNNCCNAGVNYAKAFNDAAPGMMMRLPCIQFREVPHSGRGTYIRAGEASTFEPFDRRGHVEIPCQRRVMPTADQVQADRKAADQCNDNAFAAMRVSLEWRVSPAPTEDRHGVLPCPVCEGALHVHQSSVNGHVHGACATEGCVRWME